MVFDRIENYRLYTQLSPQIAKALKIAAETDFEKVADGKYAIDSDKLYYLVQRYKTAPATDKLEVHRKYIDIQFLVKGPERIGYGYGNELKQAIAYDEHKDIGFLYADKDTTFLNMTHGNFAVLWPDDAHMPGRQIDKPLDVLKIVFKIRM